jgi:4-hydroxy-tetrahydrodipicolinate reductase
MTPAEVRSAVIVGYGKMGRAVESLALQSGWSIAGTLDSDWLSDTNASREVLARASVAVEFSEPAQAVHNILAIVQAGCPVVVGTTGWYHRLDEVSAAVMRAGGKMLWSPNFSVGAQILMTLARTAGELARSAGVFDAHIVETHHAAKKDMPSGTAIKLGESAEYGMQQRVPITSVRVGHEPGKHELIFDAPFEQVKLVHTARDRRVFAAGALLAADWLCKQPKSAGVFTMRDILQVEGTER